MLIIIHGTSVSKCRYLFLGGGGGIYVSCIILLCMMEERGELRLHAKRAGMDVRFSSVLVKLFNFYVI
jgi:hypothetical protein